MPIDAARAVAAAPRSGPISWTRADVQLYHLGVGAGVPADDPGELSYLLEDRLHVLPGFATVAGGGPGARDGERYGGVLEELSAPGVDVDPAAVLHGTQTLHLHRPIPPAGSAVRTSRIADVYDKGKAAVVVLRAEVADAEGPLWASEAQLYVRGEGGFGGARGRSPRLPALADRPPDRTVLRGVREDQALLYRLSGDANPLHADPEFAARAGFAQPILHGLCSYGIALKAVVDGELGGAAARVRRCTARFAGVVYPGETLRVRMWRQPPAGPVESTGSGGGAVRLTAAVVERDDAEVLTDAEVTFS